MTDPPRARSSTVAVKVTGRAPPGGSGSIRMLPAHRTGPSRSPPGRAIAKVAFDVSEAVREGFPSSWAVIRIRYATPFGTTPRSHVYVLADPGSVAIGLHVSPPSALAWRTRSEERRVGKGWRSRGAGE